jgi:lipoprotein-anchoring transpeptidase ErfK/SrfK
VAGVIRSRLPAAAAIGCCVLLVSAATAAAAKPARPDVILSNETTSTTWSVADKVVAIRARPRTRSARIGTLQLQTPDGFLQSYLLLRERPSSSGWWVQLRIPGRPNGRTGWVPRGALDSFNDTNMEIVVDRATRQLTLYRAGRVILQAPVGVGKPSTPTPPGHFWITESFASTDPFYGPWAFATSDYSTLSEWPGGGIVGLHGTNQPSLVPGDPSHGCIRLHNADVLRMASLVAIGTPLLVQ